MPTSARPRRTPPIADNTVIDLANRRARSKSSPETEAAEPSGRLGAMPETTGFFNCPDCGNTKFMVWSKKLPQGGRELRIYCDDYGCDWSSHWLEARILL